MEKNILVINNDKNIRHLFKFALSRSKYELETALTIDNGILKADLFKPEIVFLDHRVLETDFTAILKQFDRVLPKMPPIYIICDYKKDYEKQIDEAVSKGYDCKSLLMPIDGIHINKIINDVGETRNRLQVA